METERPGYFGPSSPRKAVRQPNKRRGQKMAKAKRPMNERYRTRKVTDRDSSQEEYEERDRQYQEASRYVRQGCIRAGGGFLVRRKKIGGE